MEAEIGKAISLRKQGQYIASRNVLKPVLEDALYRAQAHLHIAWSYDNEGKEQEAITHYSEALKGPISERDRFESLFGLACTYRSLGKYDDALAYFEQTLLEYPNAKAVTPFYAMCLYNLGRAKEAVQILLEQLVLTTSSSDIKDYQEAILLYSKDLDRKW